jgi:hypothetical protein
VVLDGLVTLKQEISQEDRDAFVHTWSVVGSLMGVRDELLPRDHASARRLLDAIRQQQAARTDDGVLLTSRTVDAFHDLLRTRALPGLLSPRSLAVLVVRTLLDPRTAELTGVPEPSLADRMLLAPLLHLVTLSVGVVDWIAHHDHAARFVQGIVARHMVEHLAALSEEDAETLFFIPEELRESWAAQAAGEGS